MCLAVNIDVSECTCAAVKTVNVDLNTNTTGHFNAVFLKGVPQKVANARPFMQIMYTRKEHP